MSIPAQPVSDNVAMFRDLSEPNSTRLYRLRPLTLEAFKALGEGDVVKRDDVLRMVTNDAELVNFYRIEIMDDSWVENPA